MAVNPKCRATCRDCGRKTLIRRSEFERHFRPRCGKCGGFLEPSRRASFHLEKLREKKLPPVAIDSSEMTAWKTRVIKAAKEITAHRVASGEATTDELEHIIKRASGKKGTKKVEPAPSDLDEQFIKTFREEVSELLGYEPTDAEVNSLLQDERPRRQVKQ